MILMGYDDVVKKSPTRHLAVVTGFSQTPAPAAPQTYPQIMWIRDLVPSKQ
jgi:hypothetical protein